MRRAISWAYCAPKSTTITVSVWRFFIAALLAKRSRAYLREAVLVARHRDLVGDALADGELASPAVSRVRSVFRAGRARDAHADIVHDERFRRPRRDDALQRERSDDAGRFRTARGGDEAFSHIEGLLEHRFGERGRNVAGLLHGCRESSAQGGLIDREQRADALDVGLSPGVRAQQLELA